MGGEGVGRVLAGLRLTELVVLVTATVVWDTPPDCHFSAWSRPKPALDPLPGAVCGEWRHTNERW